MVKISSPCQAQHYLTMHKGVHFKLSQYFFNAQETAKFAQIVSYITPCKQLLTRCRKKDQAAFFNFAICFSNCFILCSFLCFVFCFVYIFPICPYIPQSVPCIDCGCPRMRAHFPVSPLELEGEPLEFFLSM